MTASPQSLLQELYEIDPSLREHEADLVPLLRTLLANDPAQKPSATFVKKLRTELATRADASMRGAVEHAVSYDSPSGFFSRFAFAVAGAVAAVFIAVPTTVQFMKDRQPIAPITDDGSGAPMGENDIVAATPSPDAKIAQPTPGATPYSARPQSGGGGDAMMNNPVSTLIAPWNPVKYRLEGELPTFPTGDVTVLTRKPVSRSVAFASIQNAFKDADIDLSTFDDLTVETVTLAQKKPFGYIINISMADGSVAINQAWDQWPHPENDCRDEACYQRLMPKPSDIPADAELIRIAGAFLAAHDIDVSSYGTPVVDDAWRIAYDSMEGKRYAWIPDTLRVIYPLIVDGKPVIDAGGEPAGISVQVSIRHDRVTDAWGFTTNQFDRSQEEAVTTRADVEKFLGMAGSQTPDAQTIALSNPTRGFVRLYEYTDGTNTEKLVPALIFRVTGAPDSLGYYQRTVAVPLVKNLLDQATIPLPIDPIPLPFDDTQDKPRPMDGGPAADASTPLDTGTPTQEPFNETQENPLMME
jgi:hypothetical protein